MADPSTAAPCPAAGCLKVQQPGMLLCRSHWFGTPKPLRDEIWRTWRGYTKNKREDPEQALAFLNEYRTARAAVLEYWSG